MWKTHQDEDGQWWSVLVFEEDAGEAGASGPFATKAEADEETATANRGGG